MSCRTGCGPATSTSSWLGLNEIAALDEFDVLGLSAHDTVVVGRIGHPLTVAPAVTLADVFAFPLIGPGMDSDAAELLAGLAGAVADDTARSRRPAELLTIECDGSDLLKGMLAESDALTFMPRFVVDDELRHGRLAEVAGVDLGLRVRFGAAWLRGRTLGGPGTAFLELLQSHDEAAAGPG